MKSFEEIYEDPREKKALIVYFLKSVLGEIGTFILVMAVAYFLQIQDNVFSMILIFVLPRFFIGGYHAETRLKCILISTLIFNLGGLICKYVFDSSFRGCLFVAAFLLMVLLLLEENSKEVE